MIRSYRSKALKLLAKGDASKLPVANVTRVEIIIALLQAATKPEDMNVAGLRFHGLHAKPKRYAVDASGNYRVTFAWDDGDAVDVDLEDYH